MYNLTQCVTTKCVTAVLQYIAASAVVPAPLAFTDSAKNGMFAGELSKAQGWLLCAALAGGGLVIVATKVWQPHYQALQLWPVSGHHLQCATATVKAFCSGSLHDHCHCTWVPAQFWGVPCCESCFGIALCVEPCHNVSHLVCFSKS